MKKTTRFFALLTSVMCLGALVFASACDNGGTGDNGDKGDTSEHKHTFDTTQWKWDETNHWNPATCEHTDEKGNVAAHVFTGDTCFCGYKKASTPEPVTKYVVTFDYNYEGAGDPITQEVESGETVPTPTKPTRTGYTFNGWTTDAAGGTAFDFTQPVTGNVTVYAQWISEDAQTYTVTFDLNYDDAPAAETATVAEGGKATRPAAAKREEKLSQKVTHIIYGEQTFEYTFATSSVSGWYTDEACTQSYDFDTAVTEDRTLYAGWGPTTYDFEAELTDLSGKTGYGYSISYNDAGMIRWDTEARNQGAHMGFCVGYLYQYGLSLEFVIHSDRTVDNVTLNARLSAEFHDIYIAPETEDCAESPYGAYEEFWFIVNNERLTYDPIALTGAKGQGESNQRPFTDHIISTTVSLKEGENTIQLFVANSSNFESTVTAVAPMVDCISLTTSATLSWEPVWSNLEGYEEHSD